MTHDPRFRHERFATLALVAAACALALYHDRALPAPLGPDAPASVFSEARASAFASSLDAPRLAGSDAEHAAFETLERALRAVAAETRAASSGRVVVNVLRTRHSGTFALRGPGVRETHEQTMAYDRLDALAARVRVRVDSDTFPTRSNGEEDSTDSGTAREEVGSSSSEDRGVDGKNSPEEPPRALLLSAHVDTVHVSPGGCDNAANVAIVLETFRAFANGLAVRSVEQDANDANADSNASSKKKSANYSTPLVAMFVSAEEDGFMGARGVVHDHPWFRKHVAAFLNFEAMGSGGPHRAFRATVGGSSAALLRLYGLGAKKPSGSVVASDVFSSGFIKSDTDFRVFRDDGDVPGIDLAFVEKTRVYHTPRDTLREMVTRRPGSMQQSGSNALGFARAFLERSFAETNEAASLKIRPGGVSTTSPKDVRRGAKKNKETKKTVSKPPLTVWFDFPVLNTFVLFDVDGTQVAVAMALVAVTSTSRFFGARMKKEDGFFSIATRLAAIVVGVVGAFIAFVAAPVAGGLAALVTSWVTKTPVPWANSLGAFALCTMPYALAASTATARLTRRCSNALWKYKSARRRVKDDDDASKDDPNFSDDDDASLRETFDADRAFSVSVALFLALLASCMFARGIASAYLFAVPAAALFLGTVVWKSWFAFAAPLAFAASLAFPTFFTLVDLAHGMTPRSRPPPGHSPYLYDIVCGVVAGGAVAATAFPTLAFLVSRENRRTSKNAERKTKDERRRFLSFLSRDNAVAVVIVSAHVVYLFAVVTTSNYSSFTEQFPQQVSAFVSVASGNVSDAALVFLPAGPGSFEDAFARTLDTSDARFRPLTNVCDTPATHDFFQRYDLASYSLAGSGACVLRSAALEKELAELSSKKAIITEIRVTTGAPRLVSGNTYVVPITVDMKGMTRWVIAVDSRCAKRVAFAQGQDAEKEDFEANADEEFKKKHASPPVGPWRSASRGRAGTGTGTHRYAAFGVGGRDARLNPRPITVWIETHDDATSFLSGDDRSSVVEKCARDAIRVRADDDFETAIAMRRAAPKWVVPFAKHHTPLKLAVTAVAGLEQERSDA